MCKHLELIIISRAILKEEEEEEEKIKIFKFHVLSFPNVGLKHLKKTINYLICRKTLMISDLNNLNCH